MATGGFHYDIRARCLIGAAVALMADVPRLASRHPLAVGTRELPPGREVLRSTAVTSRLRLGPFSYHITYRADLMKLTEDEVITVAHQRPATTLTNHARFTPEPGGIVHIGVDIAFVCPAPLFRYAFGRARFAHRELAEGIRELLENPDPSDRLS